MNIYSAFVPHLGGRTHVLKTPDVDNCLKFVQDALEPTVIENDKLIVSATVTKMWCSSASEERTEIELLVYRD